MKGLIFCLVLMLCLGVISPVYAQYSAQKEAAYLATLKAVTDYKMGDEDVVDDLDKLRQNARFNQDLHKMLDKLNNNRTKTGKNRRVYQILQRAGKEIYDELYR